MSYDPRPTALVVDDSAPARRRISTLLQLGGSRVHQAAGTEADLRLAAGIHPDLVVTELSMRDGTGVTLMRRPARERQPRTIPRDDVPPDAADPLARRLSGGRCLPGQAGRTVAVRGWNGWPLP